MPTYKSETVTIVRPSMEGDPEFKAGKDQTVIALPDGTQKTVPTSDIKEDKEGKDPAEDDQPDDKHRHKARG
jgi:hypothetical protein